MWIVQVMKVNIPDKAQDMQRSLWLVCNIFLVTVLAEGIFVSRVPVKLNFYEMQSVVS